MTDARSTTEQDDSSPEQATWVSVGLRYVLPGIVVLGGLVVMAFGSEADLEGGAGIVSAGLAVYAMSWLYRASVDGDRTRDEEEAARDYFDAHGRWPDQAPGAEIRLPARPADERAKASRATGAARQSSAARVPLRPRRPGA
jgi:hypothetical protein